MIVTTGAIVVRQYAVYIYYICVCVCVTLYATMIVDDDDDDDVAIKPQMTQHIT